MKFKDSHFNLVANSYVYHTFDVKLPEDDLKKIEACRSLRELYVEIYL